MSELTEANFEAMLIKLRKHLDETGEKAALTPNSMIFKPHQCPRCFGFFKEGDRFFNDEGTVYHWMCWVQKSKEKNGG